MGWEDEMSEKICRFCNEPLPEWAQDHGMDNCAHNLKDKLEKLKNEYTKTLMRYGYSEEVASGHISAILEPSDV